MSCLISHHCIAFCSTYDDNKLNQNIESPISIVAIAFIVPPNMNILAHNTQPHTWPFDDIDVVSSSINHHRNDKISIVYRLVVHTCTQEAVITTEEKEGKKRTYLTIDYINICDERWYDNNVYIHDKNSGSTVQAYFTWKELCTNVSSKSRAKHNLSLKCSLTGSSWGKQPLPLGVT